MSIGGIVVADMLRILDRERRGAGEPAGRGGVVRERSPDDTECRIVYSHSSAGEIDYVIHDEVSRADSAGYTLEWKVYGHDAPSDLRDRLLAARFRPDAVESVLVLPLREAALAAFAAPALAAPAFEIKILPGTDLDDVAEIARETGRVNVEEETHRLSMALRAAPDEQSVHVAYVDGEPVAVGRIHFPRGSDVAELAGGRTKTTHRNRGVFTALVGARLREALARGRTHVFVDALPTSEPILRKRGFEFVTHTQPFVYEPDR